MPEIDDPTAPTYRAQVRSAVDAGPPDVLVVRSAARATAHNWGADAAADDIALVDPAGRGYLFVSHSRRDRAYAARLVAWLRAAGVRAWISGPERHCPAWQDSIFPHITACEAFVIVMTSWSQVAGGVTLEIDYAQELGKPFIPLALDGWCFPDRPEWVANHVTSDCPPEAALLDRMRRTMRGAGSTARLVAPAPDGAQAAAAGRRGPGPAGRRLWL